MEAVFLKLVNMSITASWLILAVILLRFFLRKAPKWVMGVLWAFVAFRLICPISIESIMSLIPSTELIQVETESSVPIAVMTGVYSETGLVSGTLSGQKVVLDEKTQEGESIRVLCYIWFLVMGILWSYAAVSYIYLKKKLQFAVRFKENLWQSESIQTPFIFGIIHPRIYLPFQKEGDLLQERELHYVIEHEKAHLERGDHWWKPIGFLILAIHWFNPFCWIAYWMFGKDIELACDEKVVKHLDIEKKKMYSKTLVSYSVNEKGRMVCPLAFAETDVKNRVQNVLHYKKPTCWKTVLFLFLCIGTAVCFLTNPKEHIHSLEKMPEGYTLEKALEDDRIIIADGDVINGQEQWMEFVEKTSAGKKASVSVFYYYTLGDKSHYDPEYYESIKDDYPVMYMSYIYYDGLKYKVHDGFAEQEYRYMKRFEGEAPKTALFSSYVYYVLVDDSTVTWSEIERGMFSSQMNDGVRHKTIYTDLD